MKRCVTGVLAILSMAAMGCSGAGELGHGSFDYVCTSTHDYSCDFNGIHDFEGAVAVGATFDLEYLRDSTDIAARQMLAGVRPASPQVAEEVSSPMARGLRFLVRGEGAFLAHGADDGVLDFIHLFAEDVVDVELAGTGVLFDGMDMSAGQRSALTAYPVGPGNENLMGTMSCAWSSDDETIVATPAGSSSCSIDVSALAAGTTTLHVEMNKGVTKDITVTVEGAP